MLVEGASAKYGKYIFMTDAVLLHATLQLDMIVPEIYSINHIDIDCHIIVQRTWGLIQFEGVLPVNEFPSWK